MPRGFSPPRVHADTQGGSARFGILHRQINNDHTGKAYLNATRRFAEWCDARGITQLTDVQAFHVAAFVKHLAR